MMTVIAKLKIRAGADADFEAAARDMIAHVKANEPGTIVYLCHRSTADPTVYAFYEVYADQGAFAAHGGSPAMQAFFKKMGGLLDGRPEIELYEEIGGKRPNA